MELNITEDIRSVTDLKRNANGILKQLHDSRRPMVLTVNGKAEAVLLDAAEYDKMAHALALLKLIVPAEEDIAEGRTKAAKEFFRELKRDKGV